MAKPLIIGAEKVSLQGPGVITHEGGDPILIADVEGGLPGAERTLAFEGEEVVIDGDDRFKPAKPEVRQDTIGAAAVVRALGQANVTFDNEVAEEAEKVAA